MVPVFRRPEGEPGHVLTYVLDGDEEVSEGIVNAFLAADLDVYDRPTRLDDWVDVDALVDLRSSRQGPVYVSAPVWHHRVHLGPSAVRIYREPTAGATADPADDSLGFASGPAPKSDQ